MASTAEVTNILRKYQRNVVECTHPLIFWEASRQIGKSFTLSLKGITESFADDCDTMLCSSSMRQSIHLMRKVYMHLHAMKAATDDVIKAERETKTECLLPNGRMIYSLPSNPDTIRGFTGNVLLDEYSRHPDQEEIWRAAFPITTNGYKLRVAGTPRGKRGRFYKLHLNQKGRFRVFRTTIYDAIADGLVVDLDLLKEGMDDPDGWAQEFEVKYVDEAESLIPYDLIDAAEDENATMAFPPHWRPVGELYGGMDIGRKRHLSVLWIVEKLLGVFWTRAVIVMRKMRFAEQEDILWKYIPMLRRVCIDSTGLGMQMAERAQEQFGQSKVEAVNFGLAVKEDLAVTTRRTFEDNGILVPIDYHIREDIHAVRKHTTSAGNVRYLADESADGHADRFWSLALALHGGTTPSEIIYPEPVSRRKRKTSKIAQGY